MVLLGVVLLCAGPVLGSGSWYLKQKKKRKFRKGGAVTGVVRGVVAMSELWGGVLTGARGVERRVGYKTK